MPRGQRRPIEDKIAEKEEIIESLQLKIKEEQKELEALYNEKRLRDLESIANLIKASGLSEEEISEALQSYTKLKSQNVS